MKPECSSAVCGALGRDFSKISPKPAPWSRSQLRRGRRDGVRFTRLTCRRKLIMKPECSSAIRGASGRDFVEISPTPAPWSRCKLRRGRGPGRLDG